MSKMKIRQGVFETNSSSVHSITMCEESDFLKWKNGEMVWNRWNDKLVPYETYKEELDDFMSEHDYDENDDMSDILEDFKNDCGYYTFEQFEEMWDCETYTEEFTTSKGDTIVAFGYYGHD